MTRCPNCNHATEPQALPGVGTSPVIEVEACAPCNLFWFAEFGSLRLTPQAVIDLFRYVGAAAGKPRNTLATTFSCATCERPLVYTQDLQRTTRFSYWRCPRDRGQLITFHQFLRQKNFIRTPSPAELARLRETVRQVACSQCGAPIDLEKDSACGHCGTPVVLIDPDGVVKALRELSAAAAIPAAGTAAAAFPAFADAQVDALLHLAQTRDDEPNHDLLAIGLAAAGAWLADVLLSN